MDSTGDKHNSGELQDFRLVLHGTSDMPHHMKNGPRVYNEDYNIVQNERSERRFAAPGQYQSMSESTSVKRNNNKKEEEEDNNIQPSSNHWLRLLARLNGDWVQ